MKAVILAAGMGKRLQKVSGGLPIVETTYPY